jgi:hypothetical protein
VVPREGSLHLRLLKEVGKLISSTKLLILRSLVVVVEKSGEFVSAFSARDVIHMNKKIARHPSSPIAHYFAKIPAHHHQQQPKTLSYNSSPTIERRRQ